MIREGSIVWAARDMNKTCILDFVFYLSSNTYLSITTIIIIYHYGTTYNYTTPFKLIFECLENWNTRNMRSLSLAMTVHIDLID